MSAVRVTELARIISNLPAPIVNNGPSYTLAVERFQKRLSDRIYNSGVAKESEIEYVTFKLQRYRNTAESWFEWVLEI